MVKNALEDFQFEEEDKNMENEENKENKLKLKKKL